jgi:very-short-patch-repair endonuclease/DNA polymerase III delta prime subunit
MYQGHPMTGKSVLQGILDNARQELLDVSTANRLLNTSRTSRSSHLDIVDATSDEVFRRLVIDRKAMSFQPRYESDQGPNREFESLLFQPDADESVSAGAASRQSDDKLQTTLNPDQLQKKLLKLSYDARTYEEEQGVNILYLALGFLKWYEDEKSERERFAPLLLVPVNLDRTSATARFKIRFTEDDIATNLSLQARLKSDFGIDLPEVTDVEELTPSDYFGEVAAAVQTQARWQILGNDIVLWFFSFSKYLMYRDLDRDRWPKDRPLDGNRLITSLLTDGFGDDPPLCADTDPIDRVLDPREMIHILDADSSQALVIEEAKRGRNLVIQGPPGTGKSQTIANLIAAAVKERKTVLFVAEKMAALEVVERRLQKAGLEDMCLELHSNKANKRAVLLDLEHTLNLRKPSVEDAERHCEELLQCRDRINRYLEVIHTPVQPCGLTPYQIVGHLVRLRSLGTRPPDFNLDSPLRWTRREFQDRLNLVREFIDRVQEIGTPKDNPWCGVQLDAVLPTDVDRIMKKLAELLLRFERLAEAAMQLARLLNVEVPSDLSGISAVARLANRLAAAPPMDRSSLGSEAWSQQRGRIDELIQYGTQLQEQKQTLSKVVVDAAWDTELAATRRNLAGYGRSWFRFLHPGYRQAQADLRGIMVDPPPKALADRLAVVDGLIAAQKAKRELQSDEYGTLGKQAFGSFFTGENSDWQALAKISQWESECRQENIDARFRDVLARFSEMPDIRAPLGRIRSDLQTAFEEFKTLFQLLKLDVTAAFQTRDHRAIPLTALAAKLRQWHESPEALSQWVNYFVRRTKLEGLGLTHLVAEVHSGKTSVNEAVSRCELAYYEALIRDVLRREPDLATFNGASHEQLLEKFRRLDKERMEIACHEVALAHFQRLPGGSDVGEVGLVRREIQKKRRHLPIRKLLSQAGRAVQAIKPVFMMSPISVAQYLEPGLIDFDLLLIDEASQVQPVDALGAVARARQIVVVGDSKQLPPTRFFSRMLGEDQIDDAEESDLHAGDMESILGLCCAQNVPQRMLSWHYRSRHHSLIAVSNHEFYDNKLYVIPSPGKPAPGQGLIFHCVENGVFDRGGSSTNRVEAKCVAEAVMDHARRFPEKTLGVGAFSVVQRDAILDELELLRRADPSLEHFFMTSTTEPFFVKNLENIQGDERDVILISVGYGKDSSGYMAMGFGPLSSEGGERRLNVLITRARDCCCVYSSIRAVDIDLNRARGRGPQALKSFLKYAESGLLDTGTATGEDHDSEFERQVAKAVLAQGYETHPQVGVAGFFIDLAVVDPEKPGQYLLGIECDGANYHRSRSARDRDRLRQAVLEDRGWNIHRIWSTDWFHRPEVELRKVMGAIKKAKIDLAAREAGKTRGEQREASGQQVTIARRDDVNEEDGRGAPACSTEAYVVASFWIQANQEIHELPSSELARVVAKIIDVEGPIHREEITRRVTQLWGLQRTGKRVRDSVDRALRALPKLSFERLDGEFFAPTGRADFPVRYRGDVPATSLRKPDMLPPAEIRKAVKAIIQCHLGAGVDEVVVETARLFGFKSTSAQLKQVIEREMLSLTACGELEERNGKLYVGGSASTSPR